MWEQTWEGEKRGEMKEAVLEKVYYYVLYIIDSPDQRRIADGAHLAFLG